MSTPVAFPPVFRSRWGLYYPCDYETYRMLRRIRGMFETARKRAASWNRWHRKAEWNRREPKPELIMPFTKYEIEEIWVHTPKLQKKFQLVERLKATVPWHIMCEARLMAWGHSRQADVVPLPVTKEQIMEFSEELGLPPFWKKVRSAEVK